MRQKDFTAEIVGELLNIEEVPDPQNAELRTARFAYCVRRKKGWTEGPIIEFSLTSDAPADIRIGLSSVNEVIELLGLDAAEVTATIVRWNDALDRSIAAFAASGEETPALYEEVKRMQWWTQLSGQQLLEVQERCPILLLHWECVRSSDDFFGRPHADAQYWLFRNRIVEATLHGRAFPQPLESELGVAGDVETEKCLTLIKHCVLAEDRQWKRITHQVKAFENFQGIENNRREPISDDVRIFVWQRDEGRCVRCGAQESLEFDHIIPHADGGSSTERNVQLLCGDCNKSKGRSVI